MRARKILTYLSSHLKHRITLQQRTTSADGAGGVVFGWTEIATVWAAVEQVSLRERLLQARTAQEALYRFYVRFRDDIGHNDRISYNGAVYQIVSIGDIEQLKVVLEIVARRED